MRSEHIREQMKTKRFEENITEYQTQLMQHLGRMYDNKVPKITANYKAQGIWDDQEVVGKINSEFRKGRCY